jgi:hypothetical protein
MKYHLMYFRGGIWGLPKHIGVVVVSHLWHLYVRDYFLEFAWLLQFLHL